MATSRPNHGLIAQALEHGVRLHQAGDFARAEAIYRQILQVDAGNADATHLLGMLALAMGRPSDAIELISKAIQASPSVPHFHANLGNAYREAGRLAEAAGSYERALAVGGESPEVLNNLGIVRLQLGADGEAVVCFERSLAVRPGHAGALTNLASALTHLGRLDEALVNARAACQYGPELPAAHAALGAVLAAVGDLEAARDAYGRAVALAPGFPEAHIGLAGVLGRLGEGAAAAQAAQAAVMARPEDHTAWVALGVAQLSAQEREAAIASFSRAAGIMPGFAPAYINMGVALSELGRHVEAVETLLKATELAIGDPAPLRNLAVAYHAMNAQDHAMDAVRRALELAPDDPATLELLGTLLGLAERPEGAIDALSRAAARLPDDDRVCGHYGLALERAGRFEEAHEQYFKALRLAPGAAIHHLRLGTMQLRLGDYVNGWREYESRLEFEEYRSSHPVYDLPRWRATAGKSTDTVVMSGEQGFGDVIQFARFAKHLRERCGKVVLHVRAPLERLLRGVEGVSEIAVMGRDEVRGDAWVPAMSLPLELGLRGPEEVPATVPYVHADMVATAAWRRRLERADGKLRVGLAWSGNPAHHLDRSRSIPPDLVTKLREVPGVAWYSMQKGRGAEELPRLGAGGWEIEDLGPELSDFADTAAAMMNLDLVVTVDTAVAHLAGALARPVWIMNHAVAEWRWHLDRRDSPWYPTAVLFRQPRREDWSGLLDQVVRELTEWASQSASRRAVERRASTGPRET